jgi:preprotein translocase subunit SecE
MSTATDATEQANRAEMDPKRLMVISYLVFGLIAAIFFGKLAELIFAQLSIANGDLLPGSGIKVANVVGLALAFGVGGYCWRSPKIHALSSEVATELMKVTWPSWEEVRVSTLAVVVASLVAAILLFAMDTLSYKIIVEWLPVLFRGGNS